MGVQENNASENTVNDVGDSYKKVADTSKNAINSGRNIGRNIIDVRKDRKGTVQITKIPIQIEIRISLINLNRIKKRIRTRFIEMDY